MKEDQILNQSHTLSLILGRALCALFPKTQLIEYASRKGEFYYEFYLPESLNADLVPLIQEEMLGFLDKDPSFYPIEIIPKNAIELFKHQGQDLRAQILKGVDAPLLDLIKLDDHYDIALSAVEGPFEGAFKLTHFETSQVLIGGEEYTTTRLFGTWAHDKKELKKKLQAQRVSTKFNHEKLGSNLDLFFEEQGTWIYLPKGVKALQNLKNKFNEVFEKYEFQETHISPYFDEAFNPLFERARAFQKRPIRFMNWTQNFSTEYTPFLKGVYNQEEEIQNQFKICCLSQQEVAQECISCLKFYLEIIKISGFSYELEFDPKNWTFSEEETEVIEELNTQICSGEKGFKFRLLDHLGRNLLDLELEIKAFDQQVLIEGKIPSLEKLLAWMLEDRLGKLPSDICAQEVHILSVKGAESYAKDVYHYFKQNKIGVKLDETDDKLETKLYKALKKQQSYIAILGMREKAEQKITLKRAGSKKQESLTKEDLLEELKNTTNLENKIES